MPPSDPPGSTLPPRSGIGLRAVHHDALLELRPAIGWLEAHSENYFALGGAQPWYLEQLRAHYPLSLHGVGLSIGGSDPLDDLHLANLARIIKRFEPAVVSEHLCWSNAAGISSNDLLPLPYTEEALKHMVSRVHEVQERLGRQVLIENVSSYLEFEHSTIAEWDFLAALIKASGCGLLLDINNIYVNACNHGFDAGLYLSAMPAEAVQEIHLAGHSVNRVAAREIRIDTHSTQVCEAVWSLYQTTIERLGPVPTLIEWDLDIPALPVLCAEAERADRIAANAIA